MAEDGEGGGFDIVRGDVGAAGEEGEGFGDHSGLGLAISKQIIDAHGGTITAANRAEGSGAIFTFTLKRALAEKKPASDRRQAAAERRNSGRRR